jgi:large subunit ribosomal protein L21
LTRVLSHYYNASVVHEEGTLADYAIVQTGGKQYRVTTGDTIRVESIPGDIGDTVELNDVRMVSNDGQVTLGTPNVEGVRIVTEISERGKGKKITVLKYKPKVRYRRKKGHRQHYTDLTVTDIVQE